MKRPGRPSLLSMILVVSGVHAVLAQPTVTFDLPPGEVISGVGFPVRITVRQPDGSPDGEFRGSLPLRAYQRTDADPVISEIAEGGEVMEITHPGSQALSLEGWHLEVLQSGERPERVVRQRIPTMTIAPGDTLVWTSRTNGPLPEKRLTATEALNPPYRPALAFRLRDPGERLADQVWTAAASRRRITDRWFGPPLSIPASDPGAWVRRGAANRFGPGDWRWEGGSPGIKNPGLSLPWTGTRTEIPIEPTSATVVNGVWNGRLTVISPGPAASLACSLDLTTWQESPSFSLLAAPRDPITGGIQRLELGLDTESDGPVLGEATPGTRILRITARGHVGSSLTVRLASDAPEEIAVPASVVLSESPPFRALFGATNADDSLADGRSVVTVTAFAEGFAPASLTLYNEDNESGVLYLQAPTTVLEASGVSDQPLRVVLPGPATRPVQILLSAEPPLEIPERLLIPAGASAGEIPLRVGDDRILNRPGRRARLEARIPGWPAAEAWVAITDDEQGGATLEWPQRLVEGKLVFGKIQLAHSRDHESELTISSDHPRLPAPIPFRIPAGVSEAHFPLAASDNLLTDGPFTVTLCASLDGVFLECKMLSGEDDDVRGITRLHGETPDAVFSGVPFPWTVVAINSHDRGWVSYTNLVTQITLLTDPALATFRPDPNPIRLEDGRFEGELTLDGEALGVTFEAGTGEFRSRVGTLDLIRGFSLPGPFLDLAPLPGTDHLLLSAGSGNQATGLLQEIDGQTGAGVRELPLTHPAVRLAVSSDGSVAWLALANGTLQRVDLQEWRVTQTHPLDPRQSRQRTKALAILPGSTERLLAVVHPSVPDGTQPRLVAYAQGRRLAATLPLFTAADGSHIEPGRSADEAFISEGDLLHRVRVDSQGVTLVAADRAQGPCRLLGDLLITATGRLLEADTLAPAGDFAPNDWIPGWNSLRSAVALPELNRAGFVDTQDQFHIYDLNNRAYIGSHGLPGDPRDGAQLPGILVRLGGRRVAGLMSSGAALRVWESPLMSTNTTDLSVHLEAPPVVILSPLGKGEPFARWKERVTITNHGPATAFGVHLSETDAFYGQSFLGRGTIGSLPPRTHIVVEIDRGSSLPELRQQGVHVNLGTPDPDPSNNASFAETAVLPWARAGVERMGLPMNHLIGSPSGKHLFAALSRRPAGGPPAVAVIDPAAAAVESYLDPEGEPSQLAVAPTGDHLYARVGSNRIARWNLALATPEAPLILEGETILDFLPLPGAGHPLAVATRNSLRIYQGLEERDRASVPPSELRTLGFTAGRLWVAQPGELRDYQLEPLRVLNGRSLALPTNRYRFTTDEQRLYFDGAYFDIGSRFQRPALAGSQFLPEPSRSVVYAASRGVSRLRADTLEVTGTEPLPAELVRPVDDIARWGDHGLALRSGSILLLYPSSLIGDGSSDLGVQLDLSESRRDDTSFTATVTVTNRGPDPATRVQMQLVANTGLRTVATHPAAVESMGGAWVYSVAQLPVGETATFRLTATPPNYAGSVDFRTEVSAGQFDPDSSNNSAQGSVSMHLQTADLALHTLSLPGQVALGEAFEAVVVVTNRGPDAASEFYLRIPQSPLCTVEGVDGAVLEHACSNCPLWIRSPEVLRPGEHRQIRMNLRSTSPVATSFFAEVSSLASDPEPGNQRADQLLRVTSPGGEDPPAHLPDALLWSDTRQEFAALLEGTPVLISKSLSPIRILPLPRHPMTWKWSSDGRYLWAAFQENRIVRLDLARDTPDLDFRIPQAFQGSRGDLLPVDDNPGLLMVAGHGNDGGVTVGAYDSGILRGNLVSAGTGAG
ncbi:MAG: hypothetical protein J0L84_08075, partial [Verrucomicrobia bacterium]|nr:hypothetical protein [Verrucomicrobiota bacterium]